MSQLIELSIAEAAGGLRDGRFSARELLDACLARVDTLNSRFNAFIRVLHDDAREAARAADARRAGGAYLGPLDGVPIALKDNIDVAGVPTTAGFGFRRDRPAGADAHCVRLLRAAGAVILGKTNLHEGALGATNDNAFFGRTYNPYGEGRTPGGSSGGSAAAVAARMCPGALGTDTLGSVRIPASYCGIVGLKPSYGLISTRGVFPLNWRLDHVGPMTRTVEDAAIMLEALAGFDRECPEARRRPLTAAREPRIEGLRLGILTNFERTEWHPAVRPAFEGAVAAMGALGCRIERVEIPGYDPGQARVAGFLMAEAAAAASLEEQLAAAPGAFSEEIQSLLGFGARMGAVRMVKAERQIAGARHRANQLFEFVDALIAPTTPQPAFLFGAPVPTTQGDLTALANIANCPSISLPMGVDGEGMPLGVQFIAPVWQEATVISLARAYERSRGAVAPPAAAA